MDDANENDNFLKKKQNIQVQDQDEPGEDFPLKPTPGGEEVDELPVKSFEELLTAIGPFGLWQRLIWAFFAFTECLVGAINLAVVFFQITPDFACYVPELMGADEGGMTSFTLTQMKNLSSPLKGKNGFDACLKYNISYSMFANKNFSEAVEELYALDIVGDNTTATLKCDKWVYDKSDMLTTVITQWDLVCDRMFYLEHSQMVWLLGYLFGSLTAGFVADKFGRKITFLVSMILCAILGTAMSYIPTYTGLVVVRFFLAATLITRTVAAVSLMFETITSGYRVWVGSCFYLPYAFGYAVVLSVVAYVTREWRLMHCLLSAPLFVVVFYYWLIPESPRWCLMTGRIAQAEAILKAGAKRNGRKYPENLNLQALADHLQKGEAETAQKSVTIFHILKYPRLLARTANLFYNWTCVVLVYYALSWGISSFAGDKFINNGIAGFVEIPAYLLCVPLTWWGRKKAVCFGLFLSGATLIAVPWIPKDLLWLQITLAMLGKLGITITFSAIILFTTELYPTVIRSSGLSACSMFSRVGAVLAPYIAGLSKLGPSYEWIPMTICGILSTSAGLLALLLPETQGKKLPDNLEDALNFKDEEKIPEKKESETHV